MRIDDDFEAQVKFEKSFYGQKNVVEIRKELYGIRERIFDSIGAKGMTSGNSEKNPAFWKH